MQSISQLAEEITKDSSGEMSVEELTDAQQDFIKKNKLKVKKIWHTVHGDSLQVTDSAGMADLTLDASKVKKLIADKSFRYLTISGIGIK